MTKGGALKSVRIVTAAELEVNGGRFKLRQGPAIKVRGYTTTNIGSRMVKGGDAQPVYILTNAQIESGGGRWKVAAGQAIPVTDVIGDVRGIIQGSAIPVFPVDDAGIYDRGFGGIPASIAGLQLWLAADLGFSLNDGDPITTWPDQSGNNNDVIQATGAKKPTYRTNIINSLPIARFDGADDVLVGGSISISGVGPGTVFLVLAGTLAAGILTAISHGIAGQNPGGNARAICWSASDISFRFNNGFRSFTLNPTASQFYIGSFWWADGAIYGVHNAGADGVDLIQDGNFDGVLNITDNEVVLGAARNVGDANYGQFFEGDLAEAIVYNTELSAGDRDLIETYLSNKYGISI